MSAHAFVTLLTVTAAAGYAGAFVAAWRQRQAPATQLFVAAWVANAAIVAANAVFCGQPPLGNMYHVLVFLSLCFLPLHLALCRWGDMGWLLGHFAFTSVFPLVGSLFIERDLFWRRVPALQSPWFLPHVVAYMVSYALAAVAFALTMTALWRAWRAAGLPWRLSSVAPVFRLAAQAHDREHQASYRILRLAFPLMTFGMLSGALWAEEAWGVYWSWDPKETWSLITWTLYTVYFHCRLDARLQRWAVPAQVAAFAALIITFLAVNLLPKLGSILHSYA